MQTGRAKLEVKQTNKKRYKVNNLDSESEKKQKFNIYIYIHAHTHTNFIQVLKSSQRTLFIRFLFPCYIINAATVAAAGSISAVTQSCWDGCCTGARSLCRVTRVLLRLWAIIRVLGCP